MTTCLSLSLRSGASEHQNSRTTAALAGRFVAIGASPLQYILCLNTAADAQSRVPGSLLLQGQGCCRSTVFCRLHSRVCSPHSPQSQEMAAGATAEDAERIKRGLAPFSNLGPSFLQHDKFVSYAELNHSDKFADLDFFSACETGAAQISKIVQRHLLQLTKALLVLKRTLSVFLRQLRCNFVCKT